MDNDDSNIKVLFKSSSRQERDLIVRINRDTDCWEVISHKNGCPYPMYRKQRVHVLSYLTFNGDIPDGMVVRHTCDNPKCCNPQHLILGTILDNNQDKIERDRIPLKYPKDLMLEIAQDNSGNYTELSKKYNVPEYTISKIKNKELKSLKEYDSNTNNRCSRKLNDKDVINIYYDTRKGVEIAKDYNISPNTVYDIKHKRIWKNILKGV